MLQDTMPQIPIAKPILDEREVEAVRRVILSGWVTQGPEVAAFEREFASCVGAPHACAVSNCTTALHLALLAVGVGAGDEVITVSHSFIATANAIHYCGATPVFIDIEPGTLNMDPALIEPAITARTRAILCVHQLGMPCDLARIVEVGRRRGIPVIEDAACASGSEILWNGQWEKIGKPHGDIACFSFHPRKVITTGDGGMITTANPEFDRKFRLWRQHSMSVPDTVRHGAREVIFESYPEVGFNFRMTDMQAAVGRVQLTRLATIVAERRQIAQEYTSRLAAVRRNHRAGRAGMGQNQLAELLRRAARVMRSANGHAADARRRRLDAARRDERAPRTSLSVHRPPHRSVAQRATRSSAA